MKAAEATKRIQETAKAVMAEAMGSLCRDIPPEFKLEKESWDGIWQVSRDYRHTDEDTSTDIQLMVTVDNEENGIEFSAWTLNFVRGGDAEWKAADTETFDAGALIEKVQ